MGFPILVRQHLYIESGPWTLSIDDLHRLGDTNTSDDKSDIGSGNDLVLSGSKPLPELVLTQIYVTILSIDRKELIAYSDDKVPTITVVASLKTTPHSTESYPTKRHSTQCSWPLQWCLILRIFFFFQSTTYSCSQITNQRSTLIIHMCTMIT